LKTFDIARKDLLRSIRSASFLAFGFFVPLLVSGLFYFALGGIASGEQGFNLPATSVQMANMDRPDPRFGNSSAGATLVDVLGSEGLAGLLQVTQATDAASARSAVDRQQAGVAMIIPAGFTAALFEPDRPAAIELYQDPTLTLGPSIVKSIVQQFVDGFAGSQIAAKVATSQLDERGVTVSSAMAESVAMQYARWAAALGQSRGQGMDPLLEARSPSSAEEKPTDVRAGIMGMIMAGMMVFYVFFTGAASGQSLLEEEEAGTLARVFTTPTRHSSILGGRLLATYVLLIVQVVMLLVLSAAIFRIDWGKPFPISLVTLGLVVLSASFGLFVTSLLKNSRQGGIIYGGVMTVMGMLGMIGIFATTVPGSAPGAFDIVSLLVPQGWAVRGWQQLQAGAGVNEVLPTVAVMLALGAVFFAIGLLRFRRRFA